MSPSAGRRSILKLGVGMGLFGTGAARAEHVSEHVSGHGAAHRPIVRPTSTPLGSATPSLSNAALMVAGPADAGTGSWAGLLAPPLSTALHSGTPLAVLTIGGLDGVTGANAFEALSNPDGSTALLVPGIAASAWLAGDPRVHFDAGRWVPALTSFGSAVLIGSMPAAPVGRLRIAASTPSGVELAALLALSLLGTDATPVFGLSDPDDARIALRDGHVDAVLLCGRDVPARCALIAKRHPGVRPIFSLGHDAAAERRDPGLASVPTMPELYQKQFGRPPSGTLFEAFKASAAAARLDTALVLQPLTPAALVAQWRLACADAVADPALAGAAGTAQLRPLAAPDCVSAMSAIMLDENTLLALRRWIAARPDWRPA